MSVTAQRTTLDELLNLVFADATATDLIRLVAESRRDFGDLSYFFTRRGGLPWHWPPHGASADTPALVVARNRDTEVRWSPLMYQQSPMPNAPARLPVLWAALPVAIVSCRRLEGYGSVVDAESERVVLARIAAASTSAPPNVILVEGSRVVPMWFLKTPIPAPTEPINEAHPGAWKRTPEEVAQRALWNLALRLDGSRDALDPRKETFACPGTPAANIFPRREVVVIAGNDIERRFAIEELL